MVGGVVEISGMQKRYAPAQGELVGNKEYENS